MSWVFETSTISSYTFIGQLELLELISKVLEYDFLREVYR
jgi:hypothetical protein